MSVVGAPSRLVLAGVPRLHFHEGGPACPEDIPFPSVMRALMEYLGEKDFGCQACHSLPPGSRIPCSYAFFVGVTGVAAFLNWKPGWEGDNCEIMYMSNNPGAPFKRALKAAGYAYEILGVDRGHDEATLRARIVESLQRGRPVIAFGPIGPPEASLITGYDEGGDILIGWSFFQKVPEFTTDGEFERTGEFRKRDWISYPGGISFIIIGERKERPPLRETYRGALEWMLEVARTPLTFSDRCNGLAAYTAWADQLSRDEDFAERDEAVLRQRHEVHNAAVGFLAEARWYGSRFLTQASDPDILHHNATEHLLHAAAGYAAEHALMWKLWDLAGGNGYPGAWRRFADREVRRQMRPIILEAQQRDEQALQHVERALELAPR